MRRVIFLILIVAVFLRFYNLMWGNGYFFNPDERNMANAIHSMNCEFSNSKLQIPNCLNPHFFAYGQFSLYLAYFSYQISNWIIGKFVITPVPFDQAIFWLRFWSATASVLTVLIVYLITKELIENHPASAEASAGRQAPKTKTERFVHLNFVHLKLFGNWKLEIGHLAVVLAAFSPGLIQSAHFGTTESLLTLFFLTIVYFSIKMLKSPLNFKFYILNSIVCGLALGTKISSAFFLTTPAMVFLLKLIFLLKKKGKRLKSAMLLSCYVAVFTLFTLLFFFLSSPYHFLNFQEARGTTRYETAVATGKAMVFYTRQFINTLPIVFQLQKIFPYALGLPVFALGSAGFLLLIANLIKNFIFFVKAKTQNHNLKVKTIILFAFLSYFLPNAFLFTKWTRFMAPVMPFFAIFASYFLYFISPFLRRIKFAWSIIHYSLFIIHFAIGLAFFSIYTRPDVRIQASEWIYENIPDYSKILSESGNVIDIPIKSQKPKAKSQKFYRITSFDFYNLENPQIFEKLIDELVISDYIFIPSRRVFANHQRLPDIYPKTAQYYDLLFDGQLGFEKVAEFNPLLPVYPFTRLPVLSNDERSEETWTVFDHPVVRIYKKTKPMTKEEYEKVLKFQAPSTKLQMSWSLEHLDFGIV